MTNKFNKKGGMKMIALAAAGGVIAVGFGIYYLFFR